ncbi:MAG: hypothetical protein R3E68_04970 [Burkholderiaceae bacterium]
MKRLLMVMLSLWLIGCGREPTEDLRVHVAGAHLLIENRTGADVHVQPLNEPVAWIPLSTPSNRLQDRESRRLRIAPSQRGSSIAVAWWRPGARIDGSGVRGPDRVRKISVELTELQEPLSTDEALVRACIANERSVAIVSPGTAKVAGRVESECMALAEQACANESSCQTRLEQQTQESVRLDGLIEKQQSEKLAQTASGQPVEQIARDAFHDLRNGYIDSYLATLCPSMRELYSGPFMRNTLVGKGADYKQRKLQLTKVVAQDPQSIVFLAIDAAILSGRTPFAQASKFRATFGRDGARPCLNEITLLS